ncbi:hypothetical protein LSTR_LSTR002871 [Laodelphax striatellus]|uniref:Uncharacterized protein n=1 Tax=Laodelphax striatellus TaxID=195883 RepID=A0A482XVX3_LAOST|nr:hypothetical protein LSTR_LSTR002871 [Laodelphax striatellus]
MELKNNTDVQTKLQEIILPDIYNFEMTLADGVSKGSSPSGLKRTWISPMQIRMVITTQISRNSMTASEEETSRWSVTQLAWTLFISTLPHSQERCK